MTLNMQLMQGMVTKVIGVESSFVSVIFLVNKQDSSSKVVNVVQCSWKDKLRVFFSCGLCSKVPGLVL